MSTIREHLADLVGLVCRFSDRIPSISDAAEFRTEASNIVGDAMLSLACLDEAARELAIDETSGAVIECSDLRTQAGGYTKVVDDLQYWIAEAGGCLDVLRDIRTEPLSLQARIEARSHAGDRLASSLLEVFRASAGLREMCKTIDRLAEEPRRANG